MRVFVRSAHRQTVRSFRSYSLSAPARDGINKYSRTVTQPKAQGASQVRKSFAAYCQCSKGDIQAMLWSTDGVENDIDFNKAMVGVGSVW